MPTIQSRKYPDNEQFVTVEAWKTMQEKGFDRRFRVVDDGDMQDTVIPTPMSFTDFSKPPIDPTIEMTRDELKAWLIAHEIDFNIRASTEKLNQLYIENQ